MNFAEFKLSNYILSLNSFTNDTLCININIHEECHYDLFLSVLVLTSSNLKDSFFVC